MINSFLAHESGSTFFSIDTLHTTFLNVTDNEFLDSMTTTATLVVASGSAPNLTMVLSEETEFTLVLSGVHTLMANDTKEFATICWDHWRFNPYAHGYYLDFFNTCNEFSTRIDNNTMDSLSFPLSSIADQIEMAHNPNPLQFYVPVLGQVDTLDIHDNPKWLNIEFPALTGAEKEINLSGSFAASDSPLSLILSRHANFLIA